jgi:3-hydroxyacyl-[acyl-carrier-protein] dehydratase
MDFGRAEFLAPIAASRFECAFSEHRRKGSSMPPALLVDLDDLNLENVLAGPEEIRKRNPHRHEMELLDAIVHYDPEEGTIAGYRDVGEDEFWVRGHIPGRPLFPGVLMVEAAAQLCSYYYKDQHPDVPFFGFAGIEGVRFRRTLTPGQRLVLLGKKKEFKTRRASFDVQGVVNGRLAFEAIIIGMRV